MLGKPTLGSPNGVLSHLAKSTARFIYFGDHRLAEYAAMPKDNTVVPVAAAGRFNMVVLVANRESISVERKTSD